MGGWTLEAAEAIGAEGLSLNVVDGLASLLDKNLVQHDTRSAMAPRFMMLETIREFALQQLVVSEDVDSLLKRHAEWFLALVEAPPPMLGQQQKLWWDQLEVEHANLRAALAWQKNVPSEAGLRLVLALAEFWHQRGHLSEAKAWIADFLMLDRMTTPPDRADCTLRPRALACLGTICIFQGDLDAAQAAYDESLALFRELGDVERTAEVLSDYGKLSEMRGDYAEANALLHESLALSRQVGNITLVRWCLFFLGTVAYRQDNRREARMFLEESLVMMRAANCSQGVNTVLVHSAMILIEDGLYDRAAGSVLESLNRMRELGENIQTIPTLEVFAHLVAMRGQNSDEPRAMLMQSARIFGAAEALREAMCSPIMPDQQRSHELGIAALRTQLDELTLAAAWAEGRRMTLDQVVAYALESSDMLTQAPEVRAPGAATASS